MAIPEEEAALIEDSVSDSVDHRGLPAGKSSTGGWRSAWYIIGEEHFCDLFLFFLSFDLLNPIFFVQVWKLERDLLTLGLLPT